MISETSSQIKRRALTSLTYTGRATISEASLLCDLGGLCGELDFFPGIVTGAFTR
jgi:hypothetical protein